MQLFLSNFSFFRLFSSYLREEAESQNVSHLFPFFGHLSSRWAGSQIKQRTSNVPFYFENPAQKYLLSCLVTGPNLMGEKHVKNVRECWKATAWHHPHVWRYDFPFHSGWAKWILTEKNLTPAQHINFGRSDFPRNPPKCPNGVPKWLSLNAMGLDWPMLRVWE